MGERDAARDELLIAVAVAIGDLLYEKDSYGTFQDTRDNLWLKVQAFRSAAKTEPVE